MKAGQVIRDVALFPMEWMQITQGMNTTFSHKGTKAIDIVGKDRTKEDAYAPIDCTLVWKDTKSGNGLCWQSDREVLWANGTIDFITFTMWHMNDISDYRVGQKFKQGEKIYEEGIAGNVTGMHIDLKVGKGKYQGGYPLLQNEFKRWYIKNEVAPFDVFFINDTFIQVDKDGKKLDGGYEWKVYTPTTQVNRDGLPYLKVKVGALNYRSSPNGERLGTLTQNAEYSYLGKTNLVNGFEWAEIVFENQIVYCAIRDDWNEIIVPIEEVIKIVEVEKQIDEVMEQNGIRVSVKTL
jgi:hypothetical protein